MGVRQKCPMCEQARIEMEQAEAGEEDLQDDDAGGDLIEQRQWTDATGRTMSAALRTVMKNSKGYFEGFFVRDDGIGFQYQIGNLAAQDVDLVRSTMVEKDLYDPDDLA
jgi:hypothetical protein